MAFGEAPKRHHPGVRERMTEIVSNTVNRGDFRPREETSLGHCRHHRTAITHHTRAPNSRYSIRDRSSGFASIPFRVFVRDGCGSASLCGGRVHTMITSAAAAWDELAVVAEDKRGVDFEQVVTPVHTS